MWNVDLDEIEVFCWRSRCRSDGRVRQGVEEPRYNNHDEAGMRGVQILGINVRG